VISFSRSLSQLAGRRSAANRRLALAFALMATLSAALLLAAAPAGAFISGEFGLQQRKPVWVRNGPLQYHDGPVIHASDSYAIYWDPLELYNSEWMQLIDKYFRNVGGASGGLGNVFALNSQYGETGYSTTPAASATDKEKHASNQSTFRGAYSVTDPYPTKENCTEAAKIACLTDAQIKAELQKVIASGKLPGATGTVPGAATTPVYYILTPPGVTVCTEKSSSASTCSNSTQLENEAQEIKEAKITHPAETGICGYHSTIEPHGATPIVYAVQPWIAGDAGLFVESYSPEVKTSDVSADVLACQDDTSVLEEPNQLTGLNPFAAYGAGLADVIVGDLANEQSNIVVDPLLNGWYQNASAVEGGSPEEGDMCQFNFGPPPETLPTPNPLTHAAVRSDEEIGSSNYYLHWAFNSSAAFTGEHKVDFDCWQGVDLLPHITAPTPVNVGDVVGLDTNESGITLDAAPLDLRQGKEETRLTEEAPELGAEEGYLSSEIKKLGEDIVQLDGKSSALAGEIIKVGKEIESLEEEEESLTEAEAELRKERRQAEEKGPLSVAEEKEYAEKEERLATRHKKAAEAKVVAEKAKKADTESKSTDEAEARNDEDRKQALEKDKLIVAGDKVTSEEEKKLADEHKLIKEREPLLAPIYKWDFGYQENGKEVTEEGEDEASVFHTFPCAKTYTVELTVVDGGGNEESLPRGVTKEITVDGKPCEEKASEETGSGGSTPGTTTAVASGSSGSAGSSAAATAPAITTKPPLPGPVASAAVVSRSLSTALKKGLLISYSVNEQVAGQFQVLLASSIANRIGLHGAPATDMPVGSAPSIVIGKAILVTTKGGRGTLKIQFGKKTAAKLRKLRSVTLTIRLVVRNASSRTPLSTTVISTVTLSH
jgi:hypothetical protein